MREPKDINVLIGCEESQAVCIEFRRLGFNAFSCDLQDCSGGHPEWHIKGDIFEELEKKIYDLSIIHPPCDFLANSGNRWFYHPEDKDKPASWRRPHPVYPTRHEDRQNAVNFFLKLRWAKYCTKKMVLENPIPNNYLIEQAGKYHQIIQPWMFGHGETKATCLWLYGLPKLKPTNIVEGREQRIFKMAPGIDRKKERSKTFPGIAKAMAEQWGEYLINKL